MYNNKIRDFNFDGIKTGLVIRNDDPKMEQRIGVYIPELMPREGSLDANSNAFDNITLSPWHDDSYLKFTGKVNFANFKWARCSQIINAGINESVISGDHNIPRKGTWVPVYFEDGDPQKLRYLPFGLPTVGQSIQLINLFESSATKTDPAKRANIYAKEFPTGAVVAMDYNEEVNSYVIRLNEGYHIKVTHNPDEQLVSLYTPKGHYVELNDLSNEVNINSHDVINETGITINIIASKVVNVKAPDINMTADNNINMTASNVNIKANVNINGNTVMNGNTTVSQNLSTNNLAISGSAANKGIDIGKDHTHEGVSSGSASSGPVKP